MNHPMVINVAVMAAVITCLVWPCAVGAHSMMNRYGKQQLAQKQNRYSSPMWLNGVNRATGWASSYGGGASMMRHYPVSLNRYQATASGNRQLLSDDYYDTNIVNPYDPRSYDRLDYAVVRYPSYGVGGSAGYYSVADLYDGSSDNDDVDDDLLYDDMAFGDRDPVPSAAASSSSYYPVVAASTAADHRYTPPLISSPLNRYESTRYPTDKIHKFRKVFMSNPVSPSNAFKTPKERQLYNFWESLVNGDLEGMQHTDYDDDGDNGKQQRGQHTSLESETSQLYQHLPSIFQQLQKQQKQKQHHQQQQRDQHQEQQQPQSAGERTPLQSFSSLLSASPSLSSSRSSSSSSSAALSQFVPHGNLYNQWANGSPLMKRSSLDIDRVPPLITSSENDDVRQLEKLKMVNSATITATTSEAPPMTTTMVSNMTTAATTVIPMADGGQREYVLPRPAGEKSGIESLLEVMAESGLHGHLDKNFATAYNSQVSTFHIY